MKKSYIFFLVFILTLIGYSCTDDGPSGPDSSDFDRQAILVNWADNIIIPAFSSFSEKTSELHTAAERFADEPTLANLEGLRENWETAYISFQQVSMFDTGIAIQIRYRDNLNIYPTDPDEIHDNIEEGSSNLELPALNDSQGFPALDYLLYGLAESDAAILKYYTQGDHAAAYRTYLTDLTARIDFLTNEIIDYWQEDYRDDFVQNSGNG
ncbi:MAG: imelysin family protein, partial [Balneolales bacterium]